MDASSDRDLTSDGQTIASAEDTEPQSVLAWAVDLMSDRLGR